MPATISTTTPFDYRHRYALHTLLYVLGFVSPWTYIASLHLSRQSTWLTLTWWLERGGWLRFQAATVVLLVLAILAAALGAGLRVWASAYLSASTVQSSTMRSDAVVADGPFRHLRNPLYLGTFLHTLAIALLMPPTGAAFVVITIAFFQIRLIAVEEPFLRRTLGQRYADYAARVPRLLPMLHAQVPSSGQKPSWTNAFLGEIYMVGVAVAFAVIGWEYNAFHLTQAVVVACGLSLIARVFIQRPQSAQATDGL